MKIETSVFSKNRFVFLFLILSSILVLNWKTTGQSPHNTKILKTSSTSTAIPIPDAYYTFEGMPLEVEAPGLIENDYDVEGGSFVFSSFSQPSNGKLTRAVTNGAFTYEPNKGFTGVDAFTYTLRDSEGNRSEYETVTIEVIPYPNYNPIAQQDFFAVSRDSTLDIASPGLFYNDFDPDEDSFVINSITSPQNGSFNFSPTTGSFSYTPDNDFIGKDSLTYQIMDEKGNLSEITTVIIEVLESKGNIPIALEDNFVTTINTTLNITSPGLLINDIDPNNQTITASNFISPVNGIITAFNSDGSFSYQPNEDFIGIDSFAYRIEGEENNLSEFVNVTINVYNLNRPPHPLPDFYGILKNETLTINSPGVLKNDYDPENDNFSMSTITQPSNGKLTTILPGGEFSYEPNLGFAGKDEFTYNLGDNMGNFSEFITVSIFVGTGSQPQTIRYIDPANENSTDGMNLCTDPDVPCKTITHAINVAEEGDTLELASSIYTESLTINKTLTLNGIGQDTISGTVLQAHADSGMANSRVILVTPGNEVSISNLIIRHGHVSGGGTSGRGGGIRVVESKLNLTNVTIEKNRAIYGGGIHNADALGIYTNVTFRNNYAHRGSADNQGTGGGIYNFRSSPILNDVDFINNKADRHGGGIRNTDESSPELTDVKFISNFAKFGGGIFNSSESSPELTAVEFIENKADSMGGGMYNSNSSPRLEDVVFNADTAESYGGGMLNTSGSNPELFDVTFNKNFANLAGGGIYNKSNSSPFLTKVTFKENSAGFGGGMSNSGSSPKLTNSEFTANTALVGGGIYNFTSSTILTNAIINDNKSTIGGGICNDDTSNLKLMSVTISGNSADSSGGGVANFSLSSSTLSNTIVWSNNAADNGNEIYNDTTSTTSLRYSIFADEEGDIVEGKGFETGNFITEDPLFINISSGDLHLQAGSPAIDAGDPDTDLSDYAISDDIDSIDLDLDPRVFNNRIDMGAYEFQGVTTAVKPASIPNKYILHQNYPNPFNPTTTIEFRLPAEAFAKAGTADFGFVSLKVYDVLGREVKTLVNEEKAPGHYKVSFDAGSLASGVYFYRLEAGNYIETKKMILLK